MNEIRTRHKTVPVLHDTDSRVFLLNGLISVRKWVLNSGYHFIAASKMIYCRFNTLVRTCIVHFVTCINTGTNILICQGQGSRLLGSLQCLVWSVTICLFCVNIRDMCNKKGYTNETTEKEWNMSFTYTFPHTNTISKGVFYTDANLLLYYTLLPSSRA